MKALFNYGISQEDARTESQMLELNDGDRLLCIASAGEVPLNLLAMRQADITAADTDLNQIYLGKLKLSAALFLPSEKAAGFLGYMHMDQAERKMQFARLQKNLSPEECHFWNKYPTVIEKGAVKAGRFEQYITRFRPIAQLILGKRKLHRLLACDNVDEQQVFFDRELSSVLLKGLFKIIFHPRIYKNRGIHEKGLSNQGEIDMAAFFYGRLRHFCTATPCRLNYFFQYTFFNQVLYAEALPGFLQPEGQEKLRERQHQLYFRQHSFSECLHVYPPHYFNKFHLSNIGDWMSPNEFQEVLRLIHQKAAPESLLSARYIHFHQPIPNDLQRFFTEQPGKAEDLIQTDRYPFYSLVSIRHAGLRINDTAIHTPKFTGHDHRQSSPD